MTGDVSSSGLIITLGSMAIKDVYLRIISGKNYPGGRENYYT